MLPVLLMYIRKMGRTVTVLCFMFYVLCYIVYRSYIVWYIPYALCFILYVLWYKCIYDMLETT